MASDLGMGLLKCPDDPSLTPAVVGDEIPFAGSGQSLPGGAVVGGGGVEISFCKKQQSSTGSAVGGEGQLDSSFTVAAVSSTLSTAFVRGGRNVGVGCGLNFGVGDDISSTGSGQSSTGSAVGGEYQLDPSFTVAALGGDSTVSTAVAGGGLNVGVGGDISSAGSGQSCTAFAVIGDGDSEQGHPLSAVGGEYQLDPSFTVAADGGGSTVITAVVGGRLNVDVGGDISYAGSGQSSTAFAVIGDGDLEQGHPLPGTVIGIGVGNTNVTPTAPEFRVAIMNDPSVPQPGNSYSNVSVGRLPRREPHIRANYFIVLFVISEILGMVFEIVYEESQFVAYFIIWMGCLMVAIYSAYLLAMIEGGMANREQFAVYLRGFSFFLIQLLQYWGIHQGHFVTALKVILKVTGAVLGWWVVGVLQTYMDAFRMYLSPPHLPQYPHQN